MRYARSIRGRGLFGGRELFEEIRYTANLKKLCIIYYARLRHFIVAEGRRRRRRSTRRRRRRRSTRRRRRRRRRKIRRRRKKKKKKNTKSRCFTSRIAYEKLCYIAMLYTYLIGNQPYNTMVVFIMRDSAPSTRYSSVSKRRSLTLPYSI